MFEKKKLSIKLAVQVVFSQLLAPAVHFDSIFVSEVNELGGRVTKQLNIKIY